VHGGAAAADWWGQALFGEEGVGGGHEGDVVVSALSGTAFKVVQAQAALEFAVDTSGTQFVKRARRVVRVRPCLY
jgi:hypothetical protein